MLLLLSSFASAASLAAGVETGVQMRDFLSLSAPKGREFLPAWEVLVTGGVEFQTGSGLIVAPIVGYGLTLAKGDSFGAAVLLGLGVAADRIDMRISARFESEVFGDLTDTRALVELKVGPRFQLSSDFILVPYGTFGVGGAEYHDVRYFTNQVGAGIGITYARHNTVTYID